MCVRRWARLFTWVLAFGTPLCASADLPVGLLRYVPADANAVILVDAEALFQTPLARRENWQKKAADRFVNQEISIPPEARRLVMASQLDLGGSLHPVWELGIVELERTPSLALIARRNGGELDTIAGLPAVRVGPRTLVELQNGLVLGTPESNRQTVSRWVSGLKGTSAPRVSPILQNALDVSDRTSQLVLALDLADSVTAGPVRELLARWEPLDGKTADQADLAEILASVRGLVLKVAVKDERHATVHVEFAKPALLMKPIAKPLVEEILRSLAISLVDFDAWTATVADRTLTLEGDLSEGDLQRVFSLFAASPATRDVQEPAEPSESASAEHLKVDASRKYFQSVKTLIAELRKQIDKSRDNHAVWMERYARKIDDLPLLNVDPDLLVFGGNVSNSLRYQAQAARSGALRAGVREAQPVYQSYSYGAGAVGPYGSYGGYSFSGSVRVSPDRNQIRTEERATAIQVRVAEMKQIEDGMVQIRRAMTERYHVEF